MQIRAAGVPEEFDAQADWRTLPIVMLDVETTGRSAERDRVVEIGFVVGRGGEILRKDGWLVNPGGPIPEEVSKIHGIRDADVAAEPRFEALAATVAKAFEGALPAAYNAAFDRGFIRAEFARAGSGPWAELPPPALRDDVEWIDPLVFARELYRNEQSRTLGAMAERLGIVLDQAHRATADAEAALRVLYALGEDSRMPKTLAALLQEQRRLARAQEEARRMWRR